ncbi:MAG: acyl-CoA dehydrogenase family protein [Chloroflexota bacterium]|nr:acyl-CoA dehydrogenase family protein [Chloroflexota bacterium]
MDFQLTEEQEALRKEFFDVCKELAKKQPSNWTDPIEGTYESVEGNEHHRYCAKEFARKGWLSRAWPREYGGEGAPFIEQAFFAEARGYHRVPGVDDFGIQMLAPTLLVFGNEEQKKEYLPPIAAGDVMWCELWSEPNAGSDLANVSTTGIRKGDDYIVNGQKTWTTGAHHADWGFALIRTDPSVEPKHRGLSFILLDMKTPGITINPLKYMDMSHMYNEVFFDDVHVPVRNLVGEENKGWRVTRALANSERSNLRSIMGLVRELDDLVDYCNKTEINGELLAKNPLIRNRLAEIACEVEAARTLAYRVAWLQGQGQLGASESSEVKIFSGEVGQRMTFLGADILGPYAQVRYSKWAPMGGFYEKSYQSFFGLNIAMGTNEIQRNIIAWEGLGLPRMR